MNYSIEHIKAAYLAAKKGILESDFIRYIEVHAHLSTQASTPAKRGRKSSLKSATKTSKAKTRKRGKRGSVGNSIRAFLASKGKEGAKVKDIAAATGNKPANVTAFFYAKANKKSFKKVAPATFAST